MSTAKGVKTIINPGSGLGREGEAVKFGDLSYFAGWHKGQRIHWIKAMAQDGTEVLLRSDEILLTEANNVR